MSGKKAPVLRLGDFRARPRTVYFTRPELNQLLGLYSRNVARGVWRDYAIDHRDGHASFSVFRHTHEGAAFSIIKAPLPGSHGGGHGGAHSAAHAEYTVLSGRQRLRCARTLSEALDYFRSKLALVAGEPG